MKEQERKCTLPEAKRRENLKVSIVKFYRESNGEMRIEKRSSGQLKRSLVVSVDTGNGGKITSG